MVICDVHRQPHTSLREYYVLFCYRFEVMSGFNGQEGLLIYAVDVGIYSMMTNNSIAEGIDENFTKDYLFYRCKTQITPQSPHLCVNYIINVYKLDEAIDNNDRARRLIEFLGMCKFITQQSQKKGIFFKMPLSAGNLIIVKKQYTALLFIMESQMAITINRLGL